MAVDRSNLVKLPGLEYAPNPAFVQPTDAPCLSEERARALARNPCYTTVVDALFEMWMLPNKASGPALQTLAVQHPAATSNIVLSDGSHFVPASAGLGGFVGFLNEMIDRIVDIVDGVNDDKLAIAETLFPALKGVPRADHKTALRKYYNDQLDNGVQVDASHVHVKQVGVQQRVTALKAATVLRDGGCVKHTDPPKMSGNTPNCPQVCPAESDQCSSPVKSTLQLGATAAAVVHNVPVYLTPFTDQFARNIAYAGPVTGAFLRMVLTDVAHVMPPPSAQAHAVQLAAGAPAGVTAAQRTNGHHDQMRTSTARKRGVTELTLGLGVLGGVLAGVAVCHFYKQAHAK